MEPTSDFAPPVVAVVVVHQPGAWFDDVLAALARQDHANLKHLVLIAGEPGDVPERVRAALPQAFVRAVDGNPGFGNVANEVLHLVEGDNGFFCFLHDDVVLEPDAIRLLVEELYRSNAGIVGPKLVEWDAPGVLQHVGYGVDRFGEVDPIVERGEVDQEQHDAVRDVFALPSACLLVRADLFRALGGFDPGISFHGEDLELCWRAHRSGARVVVVPSARARHRERLTERRPDLPHETLRARHRLRVVATLTGWRRLPLLSVELVLLAVAELVVGPFTGTFRRGVAGLRALVGLLPRTPAIIVRRRTVHDSRHVPDREVARLQLRGSARFTAYLRSRDVRPGTIAEHSRSWRERAGASGAFAWLALLVAIAIGTRHLLADGVPSIGQFLPYDPSPRHLLRLATSGWWTSGAGSTTTPPTGLVLVAVASVGTLFHTALLHTLGVVGLLVVGPLGVWRLSSMFAMNRARIVALLVYAGLPLAGSLVATGRWSALACYAAVPWFVDALRRSSGIVMGQAGDDADRVVRPSMARRVREVAAGALVVAATVAFAPGFVLVVPVLVVVLALGTALGGRSLAAAMRILSVGVLAWVLGVLLDLPWIASYVGAGGWTALVGPPPATGRGPSLLELASFDLGPLHGAMLAVALVVPVVAAPLLGRGWRLGWGARAALLVVAFGWLAVLDARGSLPFRLPEPGIVLAPAALGVALAAACVVASMELDVKGASFGWRQPLGLLGLLAVVVGLAPGAFALTSGRFETPRTTIPDLLAQLPSHPVEGDYRVLWVGDSRLVPVAGQPYATGMTFALTDDRILDVGDMWSSRPTRADAVVRSALDAISDGTTARAGRLLAPLGVRYLVVPLVDGVVSTGTHQLDPPAGLLDALGDQLDLARLLGSPPNYAIFENHAWLPTRAVLSADGATASSSADPTVLAQATLADAQPVMPRSDHLGASSAAVPAGTLAVAVPFDHHWRLRVDGVDVPGRPAFGATLAFDVPTAGTATLWYQTDTSLRLALAAQLAGWFVVGAVAAGLRRPRRVGGGRLRHESGAAPVLDLGAAPLDPGLLTTGAPSAGEVVLGEVVAGEPEVLDVAVAADDEIPAPVFAVAVDDVPVDDAPAGDTPTPDAPKHGDVASADATPDATPDEGATT